MHVLLILALCLFALVGCRPQAGDPRPREAQAKALFDRTTKEFHLPSATASGSERHRLEAEAARGYQQLLRQFPEQEYWCAEALRSLGNVRLAQGDTNAALRCWAGVAAKYPRQDWQVVMALKSSGDLLWEANRKTEAQAVYQNLVAQFDHTNAPPIVHTIVRGSKLRLQTTLD
jgi:hypothetical protein